VDIREILLLHAIPLVAELAPSLGLLRHDLIHDEHVRLDLLVGQELDQPLRFRKW
jgi:hypothetical protein